MNPSKTAHLVQQQAGAQQPQEKTISTNTLSMRRMEPALTSQPFIRGEGQPGEPNLMMPSGYPGVDSASLRSVEQISTFGPPHRRKRDCEFSVHGESAIDPTAFRESRSWFERGQI